MIILFCLLLPVLAAAQIDTVVSSGINRTYQLQLPDNYNENKKLPLILVLHGYHYEILGMPGYSGFDKFTDRDCIIAYPHGLKEENGPNYFWNSGGGLSRNYGGVDDVGFISDLIDALAHKYAVDTKRVFIVGHSNGGMMVYRLGMELSHKIAGIANVAGSMMFDTIVPEHPLAVLHIHGTNDTDVTLSGSTDSIWPFLAIDDVLSKWAAWNNCAAKPDTLANTDSCLSLSWADKNGNNPVMASFIKNQGHDWASITNSGWDVAENMWSFFIKRKL